MASSSSLSGEVWVHTQLDIAHSNAEKNRYVLVETQSGRRAKGSRSRYGTVRFEDEEPSQIYHAHSLVNSRRQSNQVLAYTNSYLESLHSKSGQEPAKILGSGNIGIAYVARDKWARHYQAVTQTPDALLTEMSSLIRSLGQFLPSKQ
jgi:hypothetical protein